MEGAILVMFSHGLLTGALFLMVGYLYERLHTRQIADMSQLAKPLPIMAGFFLFFVFGSAGLPGLSGFVGEFLSLLGLFAYSHWLAAIAATGVILAAAYLLWMFQRTMFNDRGDESVKPESGLRDLGLREIITLVPLVVLVIWVGVYPATWLNFLHVPVNDILLRVLPSLHATAGHGLTHVVDATKGLL
jgi:NADH-quinone oxidoreductase subunit M